MNWKSEYFTEWYKRFLPNFPGELLPSIFLVEIAILGVLAIEIVWFQANRLSYVSPSKDEGNGVLLAGMVPDG